MKITYSEEVVYQAVIAGELEIMSDGTIWRIRKRGWDRWQNRVVSRPCNRVRAEHHAGKYLQVRAMFDGTRYHASAHRLVYRHFKGPIPDGLTINHDDGNKMRNRPSNLVPASYSEQQVHAIKVLRTSRLAHQYGAKNAMAKLTLPEVEEMCRRRASGERLLAIARDFGVSDRTVSKIALGHRWAQFRAL